MHPHGGYKYAWPEDRDRLNRSAADHEWRRLEENATDIHVDAEEFAEIDALIENPREPSKALIDLMRTCELLPPE